ncbi:hypothetical protein FRC12_005719 [Ceratobasidium sp. 428]|nr:hypothetical protein FRC12_005719 [Ceratobasidium sp. 428]
MPYVLDFPNGWPADNLSSPWFPNLQRLVVNTYGSILSSQVEWTHRLLTPGLLSFEMHSVDLNRSSGEDPRSEHSWLPRETCSELLDSMATTCLWINTLRIFPAAPSSSETIYHSRILSGIAMLTQLSVLALGTTNLDQELFDVLGRLSHLEVLTLHNDGSQPIQGERGEISISDDLFPSLHQLEFRGIDDSDILRIDRLSYLFSRLNKGAIIFLDDGFYVEPTNHCLRSRLALHCIGTNSLRLVDLTLFTPWNHAYFALFIPGALDVFKQMPLRRLRLGRVRLQSWPDTVGLDTNILTRPYGDSRLEVHWRDFLLAVPQLEELHLELQMLQSSHLPSFAHLLPNLRLLVLLMIKFDEVEPSTEKAATQPITIRCPCYNGPTGGDFTNASSAAKYVPAIFLTLFSIIERRLGFYTVSGQM